MNRRILYSGGEQWSDNDEVGIKKVIAFHAVHVKNSICIQYRVFFEPAKGHISYYQDASFLFNFFVSIAKIHINVVLGK